MRYLTIILLLCGVARADVGVDAVVSGSGMGYETGTGIQLDADGDNGRLGYDLAATWLRQAKVGGTGDRWNVQAAARYFPMRQRFAIEAGIAHTGYKTEFPDGAVWEKSGTSPLVGAAWVGEGFEFSVRYTGPDGTANETESVYLAGEADCWGFVCGLLFRHATYDSRGAERSDVQVSIEFGKRW